MLLAGVHILDIVNINYTIVLYLGKQFCGISNPMYYSSSHVFYNFTVRFLFNTSSGGENLPTIPLNNIGHC